MDKPIVAAITCTRGRHSLLERCVGLFLKQDYEGMSYQIIFNNSPHKQELAGDFNTPNKKVILINSDRKYDSIDQIFSDAMSYVPEEVEVVTFFDDDDLFKNGHIKEGVRGWVEGGKLGYKPYYSICQTENTYEFIHNMCEPSVFVKKQHVLDYGFSTHSAAYHHQWLLPLIDKGELYEPLDGKSTFVYQWVGGCYHISGDGENPLNLANHNKNSTDEGDGIITPIF